MQPPIQEDEFLDILKSGVKRTVDFMAELTEYHGKPIRTEYILTSDIARAFLEKKSEVYVDYLCAYLKTKAMRANTDERKAALWAEYKRCLKERGEGW